MSILLLQASRRGVEPEHAAAREMASLSDIVVLEASTKQLRRGWALAPATSPPFGDVAFCHAWMRRGGIDVPAPLDYPDALRPFLHRAVERSQLGAARQRAATGPWPFFVKPADVTKRFTGVVVRGPEDLYWAATQTGRQPVWISEVIPMHEETRFFVHGGEIVATGTWNGQRVAGIDRTVVERAVALYTQSGAAPLAYALDFAVDDQGRTVLVEANDALGLGRYGIDAQIYVALVCARWQELSAAVMGDRAKTSPASGACAWT